MKRIISIILSLGVLFSCMGAAAFPDTGDVLWAKQSIDELSSKGIIQGYEDGSFRPGQNVTRAEFAKMLCLSFDCGFHTEDESYTVSHWAKDYIIRTADVVYTPGRQYMPDNFATRAEIAYALANVLKLEKTDEDMNLRFSDWNTVDEALKENVANAVYAGLIEGYENGEIRGDGFVTRAEIAVLVSRAMEYKNSHIDDETEAEPNPDDEIVDDNNGSDEESENDSIFEGFDHIYTVSPLKDVYLVSSVDTVMDDESGDILYRVTYTVSGSGEEYVSRFDEDVAVYGAKSKISEMDEGDIFIVDMKFLTQISAVYVLASFDQGFDECFSSMVVPEGRKIGSYGTDKDYEVLCGKITEREIRTNTVLLTVEKTDGTTELVNVQRKVKANVFESGRKSYWDSASLSSLSHDGTALVYIRFTDGKVTDVIASEYGE